jgi:hypothetical protein
LHGTGNKRVGGKRTSGMRTGDRREMTERRKDTGSTTSMGSRRASRYVAGSQTTGGQTDRRQIDRLGCAGERGTVSR